MALEVQDRVRAVVMDDDIACDGVLNAPESARQSSETRSMSWGWIYGLAYAIARAQDPYEGTAAVVSRAHAAARPVYGEYVGDAALAKLEEVS